MPSTATTRCVGRSGSCGRRCSRALRQAAYRWVAHPRDSRASSRCSAPASSTTSSTRPDRATRVVVDVDVLDVDPDLARRRRRAGPARRGGRAPRRRPTRVGRAGPPCLPGIAAGAGDAAGQDLAEVGPASPARRPRSGASRSVAHLAEQRRAPPSALAGHDLLATAPGRRPATRVTSRTPWPDSARCSAGASASRPATSDGEQVRQVGGAGDGPVVLVRASSRTGDRAAEPRPAPRPAPTASGAEPRVRASPPTGGRRRARRSRPAGRSARCRPSGGRRRSASRSPATRPATARSGRGLHAADVGDDGVRTSAERAATTSAPRWSGGTATTTSCGRVAAATRPPGAEARGGAHVLVGRVA